jgi:UDP-3-O-[3-hydroxymyristoyl] glucosamine N-acyltransferase
VILAGQVGISGHITLGDGVVMSARSGASKSIDKPGNYGGTPAMLIDNYNRMSVHLRNIEKYVKELKELRTIVDKLQK